MYIGSKAYTERATLIRITNRQKKKKTCVICFYSLIKWVESLNRNEKKKEKIK